MRRATWMLLALGVRGALDSPLRRAHRAARRAPRVVSTGERAASLKFSINIHEPNAPPGSAAAEAAAAAMLGRRGSQPHAPSRPSYAVRTISTFDWRIGEVNTLADVVDRVRVPGAPPILRRESPEMFNVTLCEQTEFVPLDHIYPNVAPVAGTIVAALRAGVDVVGDFDFVTERRCLKRIASLSHSLCTDLQVVNGTIFARDVPKHRCVNYGSVGHQFHRLCAQVPPGGSQSEFFHLTELRCGPHRLLVASEVDCHTHEGEGVEIKIGKRGGLSTWTQCLFANVPIVIRGVSQLKRGAAGRWGVQSLDYFEADEMLSEEAKARAMAIFARVLTQLRRSMREGRVYRLQREQRNIVCFELPEHVEPLITGEEIGWLAGGVRAEPAAAAHVCADGLSARRRGQAGKPGRRRAAAPVDKGMSQLQWRQSASSIRRKRAAAAAAAGRATDEPLPSVRPS